jgi:hypothetical protein
MACTTKQRRTRRTIVAVLGGALLLGATGLAPAGELAQWVTDPAVAAARHASGRSSAFSSYRKFPTIVSRRIPCREGCRCSQTRSLLRHDACDGTVTGFRAIVPGAGTLSRLADVRGGAALRTYPRPRVGSPRRSRS